MQWCWLCREPLTEHARSREHVIPNALGGRLSSKDLVCKSCNSTLGHDLDVALTKQLGPIATLLGISRDRGEPPPVLAELEKSQGKYFYNVDGTVRRKDPKVEITKEDGQVRISAVFDSEEQAREVLSGIQKKYQKLDVDAAMKNLSQTTVDERIKISIELNPLDTRVLRAVAKIAGNAYLYFGGELGATHHMKEFVNGARAENIVGFVLDGNEKAPINRISHIISIRSNRTDGLSFVYVELFSLLKYYVLISDVPAPEVQKDYFYDIVSANKMDCDVDHGITREQLFRMLAATELDRDAFLARVTAVMERVVQIRWSHNEIRKLVLETFEKLAKRFPESPKGPFPKEAFIQELMCVFEPWLVKHIRRPRDTLSRIPQDVLNRE